MFELCQDKILNFVIAKSALRIFIFVADVSETLLPPRNNGRLLLPECSENIFVSWCTL